MINETTIKQWMLEDNGSILYDSKHSGVFTGYVTFTPERAESALENNTHNRKLGVNKQIPPLIAAIENGLWDDNVAKINFDESGILSDGQHRLEACVRSNITIRVLVTYGVSKTAQGSTDRRGARTLQDDLTIHGYKNAVNLASMIRCEYYKDSGVSIEKLVKRGHHLTIIPDAMLFNYFQNDSRKKADIIEKVKRVGRIADSVKDLKINNEIIKILVPAFDEVSVSDADCFWGRLSTGLTTVEDDAVVLLRKRLSANAKSETNKIPTTMVAALIIKAWNFFESGTPCGTLKFVSGGATPESFPKIYNPYFENGEVA